MALTSSISIGKPGRINMYVPNVYLNQIGVDADNRQLELMVAGNWVVLAQRKTALRPDSVVARPSASFAKDNTFLRKDQAYVQFAGGGADYIFPKQGKWEDLQTEIRDKQVWIRFPDVFFEQRSNGNQLQIAKSPRSRTMSIDYGTLQQAVVLVNNAIDNGATIKTRAGKLVVIASVELS